MEAHKKIYDGKLKSKATFSNVVNPLTNWVTIPAVPGEEAVNLCTTSRLTETQKSPSIVAFVKRIGTKEKTKIDMALGKMFFSCNIPFNVAENQSFVDFCKFLNPAYRPPSHDVIGGLILDQVYSSLHATDSRINREKGGSFPRWVVSNSKYTRYCTLPFHGITKLLSGHRREQK